MLILGKVRREGLQWDVENIHLCPDEWRGLEPGDQEVTPIIEACNADIGARVDHALGSHWVASSPPNN